MSHFEINYSHDDRFYEVVSPLGVVVTRFIDKDQAKQFIEQTLRGVVEDASEDEDETKKPFRDIAKDGITYSFLDEWLLDREQARLSYVEGWASSGFSQAMTYGLAFHDCLEGLPKAVAQKPFVGRSSTPSTNVDLRS